MSVKRKAVDDRFRYVTNPQGKQREPPNALKVTQYLMH